jgi:hypothetical protein
MGILQILITIAASNPPSILIVLGALIAGYGSLLPNQGLIDLGYNCLGWGILMQFVWMAWRSGILKKVMRL